MQKQVLLLPQTGVGNTQWGFFPLMAQYKFLSPDRKWAPNILAGAGFSYGDWSDLATREIVNSNFYSILGASVEFYNQTGAWSLNYRLWHISNSGIEFPNIGLSAHILSLGMRLYGAPPQGKKPINKLPCPSSRATKERGDPFLRSFCE